MVESERTGAATGGQLNGMVNGTGSALCAIRDAEADNAFTLRSKGSATAAPAKTEIFIRSRRLNVMALPPARLPEIVRPTTFGKG